MLCRPPSLLILNFLYVLWSGCVAPVATSTDTEGVQTPLLNSERIELTFGSYGIEVLKQSDTLRVSNLYSLSGTRKVCRTFAVVRFVHPMDHRIAEEHAGIVAGGSLGAVFKSAGWTVEKQHLYFGAIEMQPDYGRVRNLMGPLDAKALAVHVYVLSVERGGISVPYATLVEVHHPAYLTLEELRGLYAGDPAVHAGLTDEVSRVLEGARRAMRGP